MARETKNKEFALFTRADEDLVKSAQKIADRDFEGVMSRLVRIAVRDFVAAAMATESETTPETERAA